MLVHLVIFPPDRNAFPDRVRACGVAARSADYLTLTRCIDLALKRSLVACRSVHKHHQYDGTHAPMGTCCASVLNCQDDNAGNVKYDGSGAGRQFGTIIAFTPQPGMRIGHLI